MSRNANHPIASLRIGAISPYEVYDAILHEDNSIAVNLRQSFVTAHWSMTTVCCRRIGRGLKMGRERWASRLRSRLTKRENHAALVALRGGLVDEIEV